MPLIDLRLDDGTTLDVLVPREGMPRVGDTYLLPDGRVATRILSMPARMTSQWADAAGTSTGFFQESLGCHVTSERHADAIAAERGLARLEDFGGKHAGRDLLDRHIAREAKRNAEIDAFEASLKETGGCI